jgi:hypothetical protein
LYKINPAVWKWEEPKPAAAFQQFPGRNPEILQQLVLGTRQTTQSWWNAGLPLIG